MRVSSFDFSLPEELIALRPANPRDSARLMVVGPDASMQHLHVRDLPHLLRSGDTLVVNNTKVIPARLRGHRSRAGSQAKVEILLHRRLSADRYSALARPRKRLGVGDLLIFGQMLEAHVLAMGEDGEIEIGFALSGAALDEAIATQGEMPLPPYIGSKRRADEADVRDYQTHFASEPGSVAAPTAGLHFTPQLLQHLDDAHIGLERVTLNVGLGTFKPMTSEDLASHKMHAEQACVSAQTASRLNLARKQGGRLVAVGTTSLRTLESAAEPDGTIHPFSAETDIYITPGYRFKTAEVLLTNFHLPRSTLFVLVSAFCGVDAMRRAYAEAIREKYRFYSYGDACLLFRPA